MPARERRGGSRPRPGTPTSPGPTYRLASGIAHREVEGQVLVLGPGDHTLLTLNATGQVLWRRLVRGATAATLARTLARAYRIDAERADRDVAAFLDTLRRRRLIIRK